jgi:hypothetical protein
MTDKAHSLVNEGSRHAIHDLTYANASDRIAGINEGKGYNPPPSNKLWHIAKQDDDDSLWMIVDVSPLTWKQIPTGVAGTPNLDDGYDNFGVNPSTVVVDAAEGQGTTLKYDLNSASVDRYFEVDTANGKDATVNGGTTYYTGFRVVNGADSAGYFRNATNALDFVGALNDSTLSLSNSLIWDIENVQKFDSKTGSQNLREDITSDYFYFKGADVASVTGLTAASGVQSFLTVNAPINQSGTAGYNALLVDVDVNAEGSGEKNLIKADYGGAIRFRVDSTGAIVSRSSTADGSTDLIRLADSAAATQFRVDSDGNTRIGIGTPGIATGAGDLYVTGKGEFDDTVEFASLTRVVDDASFALGTSNDVRILYNTVQTPDSLFLGVSADSNAMIIAQVADRSYDFAHALQTNPTLFIQSANQSLTEWLSLAHDQTYARLNTGTGAVCIGTGTPGVATGVGDLYVTDAIECDGNLTVGTDIVQVGNHFSSDTDATFGHQDSSNYGAVRWRATAQTPDTTLWMTGIVSNAIVVCEYDDRSFDFAHALQTNPTLFGHSANQSTTEWWSLTHDQTYARLNTGTGAVCIGTSSPAVAIGLGDLFVTGELELNDSIYMKNDRSLVLGTTDQARIIYGTGQNPDGIVFGVGASNNSLILAQVADIAFNFAHSLQTNPTLFGHSANQSTTEWWSLTHDQTDAVLASGAGALSLAPASGVIKYPDAGQTLYDISPASNQTATGDTTSETLFANNFGFGNALYQKSDGEWADADADAISTMPCRALALESGTGTKLVLRRGWIRDDAWSWTPGAPVYISTTGGGLTQTKPSGTGDQVQIVGYAETADILDFNPSTVIVEVA